MSSELAPVSEKEFLELKDRLKLIFDADPEQYHNDHSLKRFLRAFKTVDAAFQVYIIKNNYSIYIFGFIFISFQTFKQAILKNNKWRKDYNVASLTEQHPSVLSNQTLNKAVVLRHRDMQGRPVIYIPAKNHSVNGREIEELTQFIVHCLVNQV